MGNAENPENPYSFLNFLNGHDDVAVSQNRQSIYCGTDILTLPTTGKKIILIDTNH